MHFDMTTANNGQPVELFCNICKVYVQERTKHCGTCNRCCSEFDHHCNWLNNCIGSENYQEFRILINWFFAFITLHLVLFSSLWACGLLKASDDGLGRSLVWVVCISAGISVIVWLFDLQLILFHVWLSAKNITTFEFVLFRREDANNKADVKKGYMSEKDYREWR